MPALFDFKGYDNFVLAEQIESISNTKLDVNRFMTPDYDLAENPGMKKIIHKYTGTGTVEDLARGEGNSNFVDAEYKAVEYTVGRTQGTARYYLDDLYTDPKLIDAKIQYLSEGMVNNWTNKAMAEFNKTTHQSVCTNFDLADFADAIGEYAKEFETQEGLFFLANIKMVPTLRKQLGDYLKYTEAYIRTGAIGDILGVPVYTSKAVPEGLIFMADNKAVTAFIKQGVAVEQDNNIDTKLHRIVASRYAVIALTDEKRCVKMGKAQSVTLTATQDTNAITGAAVTGAVVTAYDEDGNELGHATASSNTYSISCTLPEVGTEVRVVSEKTGFLPSETSFEVA